MIVQELLPQYHSAHQKRYLALLQGISEEQLSWKIPPATNSIGFLIRHIAEVEYAFSQMFFNQTPTKEEGIYTLGKVIDTGVWTNLNDLMDYTERASQFVLKSMELLPEESWDQPVESRIGVITPRDAFGMLIYHKGYHAGQIGWIKKYGAHD
ncbi:DinB family protein [Brevibacterium sp. JNUCC-42]|nr:DinB family protein [Brevibacterium sp. JNUCC-42]